MDGMTTAPTSDVGNAGPLILRVRPMAAGDAEAVLAIYREGIETGHATFQDSVPCWHDWDGTHLTSCRRRGLKTRPCASSSTGFSPRWRRSTEFPLS